MKKCDICGKFEAQMKVRQVDKDGKQSEVEVCVECARQRGFSEAEKVKIHVAEVLSEMKQDVKDDDRKVLCPSCGMSYADFKRLGRLGCAQCYDSFRERLEPLVRRLHGAVQHVGKSTTTGRKHAQERMNRQRLTEELDQAIKNEDYEKAAAVRDQMRRLETNARG